MGRALKKEGGVGWGVGGSKGSNNFGQPRNRMWASVGSVGTSIPLFFRMGRAQEKLSSLGQKWGFSPGPRRGREAP